MVESCDKALFEALGGDEEIVAMRNEMRKEVDRRVEQDPSKSRIVHESEVIDDFIADQVEETSRAELLMLNTLEAREQMIDVLEGFAQEESGNYQKAFTLTMESRSSVVQREADVSVKKFERELQEASVDKFLASLPRNRDDAVKVAQEIQQLNMKTGKPGISGSDMARQVAEIYQTNYNTYRKRMKDLGLRVEDLEGFIIRQVWDAQSLRNFGKVDEFVEAMTPLINREKTFGDARTPDKVVEDFLKGFYSGRVNGNLDDIDVTPKSLVRETFAGKQLKNREIHLNSPEATVFVVENFGAGEFGGAMIRSLRQIATKTKVTEVMGANPRDTFDTVFNRAKRRATPEVKGRMENPGLKDLLLHDQTARGMLDNLGGRLDLDPANPSAAQFFGAAGNGMRAILLQRVVASALPDLVTGRFARNRLTKLTERAMARQGKPLLRATANQFDQAMARVQPEFREAIALSINSANAYNLGTMGQNIASQNILTRASNSANSLANATFKYGGMDWFTRTNKGRNGVFAGGMISQLLDVDFNDMPGALQKMFLRGSVTEKDWKKLRSIDNVRVRDGNSFSFLNIERVREVDPALADRLLTVIREFAEDAIVTPSAADRSLLTLGTRSGDVSGEVVKAMTSLLGWPTAFLRRGLGREMEVNGVVGVLNLTAQMTMMGYVSLMAHDVLNNRTRDYLTDDLEQQRNMLFEAMTRGGAGGLLGGIVIDTFTNSFSDGPISSLTDMPAASVLDRTTMDLYDSILTAAEGDFGEAVFNSIDTVASITPLINLPGASNVTQGALDKLQFELDPSGYRRDVRNMKKYRNQEPLLPMNR